MSVYRDKFSKFSSQSIKVYIIFGKYLWFLCLVLFHMLNLRGRRAVDKIFLSMCLWQCLCVSTVGGMVMQLQRLNSCSSKAATKPSLWRTCRTCESPASDGFLFHLTCHLVFGRSHRIKYPSVHPTVTPVWSRGVLWLVGQVPLLHLLYQSWWVVLQLLLYSPAFVAFKLG